MQGESAGTKITCEYTKKQRFHHICCRSTVFIHNTIFFFLGGGAVSRGSLSETLSIKVKVSISSTVHIEVLLPLCNTLHVTSSHTRTAIAR